MTPPLVAREDRDYTDMQEVYSDTQTELTRNIEQYIPYIQKSVLSKLEELIDEKLEAYHQLNKEQVENKVIIIEEISREEAKTRIIQFFKENDGDFYPSDITQKLHIDYDMVWDILGELENEGMIE
jgi:hypothetical protein